MVHVEQDPRHDLDASPLSTVLGYDLERSLLRRRLTDLGAKLEEAAQTAEVAAPGEKAAADRHAARVQKRCEEAEALLRRFADGLVACGTFAAPGASPTWLACFPWKSFAGPTHGRYRMLLRDGSRD